VLVLLTLTSCVGEAVDCLPGFYYRLWRRVVYDSDFPEFSTTQVHFWSVAIGILMGVATWAWKEVTDLLIEFIWKTTPNYLYERDLVFTASPSTSTAFLALPLPFYYPIATAIITGVLMAILQCVRPFPSQNSWIDSLHRTGTQDPASLLPFFLVSTLALGSGLSLGPEMPLVILAGMFGTIVGKRFRQYVGRAREGSGASVARRRAERGERGERSERAELEASQASLRAKPACERSQRTRAKPAHASEASTGAWPTSEQRCSTRARGEPSQRASIPSTRA
jgi:hypothetical protein